MRCSLCAGENGDDEGVVVNVPRESRPSSALNHQLNVIMPLAARTHILNALLAMVSLVWLLLACVAVA